jgi:exosortase D (VPLPA-CTERM-specific)
MTITSNRWAWALVIASVAIAFSFSEALHSFIHSWLSRDEYSHGFFIVLVVLYLVWLRRNDAFNAIANPAWSGLAIVTLGCMLLVAGALGEIFVLMQLAFVVSLFGLALSYGGFQLGRVAFVPLFYLLFAIPIPYFLEAQLSLRLQLLSSELGAWLLRALDLTVFVDGNIIDLGQYQLQIVEACDGLRYLYPLLGISFLVAYLFRGPRWQRLAIFLAAAPIALVMNSVRIALAGVLVNRFGAEMADGITHFFEGWIVFIACVLLLMSLVWLFSLLNGEKDIRSMISLPIIPSSTRSETGNSGISLPFLASVSLVVVTGLAMHFFFDRQEQLPERNLLASLPTSVSGWDAVEKRMEPGVEQALAVDDYLVADFSRYAPEAVNLYVAYYEEQRGRHEPHSPRICLPGSGWRIADLTKEEIAPIESGATPLVVNRVKIVKGGEQRIVYYWYEQRGRSVASWYAMKWYTLWDALVRNRTDGALVRLMTTVNAGEEPQDADERLSALLGAIRPKLKTYIPG